MLQHQTAVLIFARDIREEVHEKLLFGQDRLKNTRLFENLNSQLKKTITDSQLPFHLISTRDQVGSDFQEKYQNAIKTIFDKGYDKVIVVGNDSPELNTETILKVEQELFSHDLVYGRTTSGGIYTLGLTKNRFDSFDFQEIPWQTAQVGDAFRHLSELSDATYELEDYFAELNTNRDICNFLILLNANSSKKRIYGVLFDLQFDVRIPAVRSVKKLEEFFTSKLTLRGPPELLTFSS